MIAAWRFLDPLGVAPQHQGAGFADQVVDAVGERSRRADARLEGAARRMLHRSIAAATPGGPTGP